MKHAICSDGIFLAAPLSTIYWNVPVLKNKDKKNIGLLCDLWRQIRALENGWKTKPCINLKAVFPENFDVTAAPLWDLLKGQGGTLLIQVSARGGRSPCQTMWATKQPADGPNPSPVACAGPQPVTLSSRKVTHPRACLCLQSLSPKKCLVLHSHPILLEIKAKFIFPHAQRCNCRLYFKSQLCHHTTPGTKIPEKGFFFSKFIEEAEIEVIIHEHPM